MTTFWILLQLRMTEVVVKTGAIRGAKHQLNHHHQQTNTHSFLQAGCPSCRPVNNVKALKYYSTCAISSCYESLSLSVLTAIFQVNLGQPVFIESKDDESGGDNWATGATSRAKLQSNHHHQQTNIQFFTGWMPFLSPNQQCQSIEWKISHSML